MGRFGNGGVVWYGQYYHDAWILGNLSCVAMEALTIPRELLREREGTAQIDEAHEKDAKWRHA